MSTDEADEKIQEWKDLSTNRAGQSAREKATELWKEAPIKSVLARLLGSPREEKHWAVGADGEEEVAWRLRKLGEGWHVIHSVPVGEKGSDIDHVVIGPAGVFTLNTKNHSRNRVTVTERGVYVNGKPTDYLRNSRFRRGSVRAASFRWHVALMSSSNQ